MIDSDKAKSKLIKSIFIFGAASNVLLLSLFQFRPIDRATFLDNCVLLTALIDIGIVIIISYINIRFKKPVSRNIIDLIIRYSSIITLLLGVTLLIGALGYTTWLYLYVSGSKLH